MKKMNIFPSKNMKDTSGYSVINPELFLDSVTEAIKVENFSY